MPLKKRDHFRNRFNPDKFYPKLQLVDDKWSNIQADTSFDCGEDSCYSKHEEESELIREQFSRNQAKSEKINSQEKDPEYIDAIRELDNALPSMEALIRWVQNTPPPLAWSKEDEDLF